MYSQPEIFKKGLKKMNFKRFVSLLLVLVLVVSMIPAYGFAAELEDQIQRDPTPADMPDGSEYPPIDEEISNDAPIEEQAQGNEDSTDMTGDSEYESVVEPAGSNAPVEDQMQRGISPVAMAGGTEYTSISQAINSGASTVEIFPGTYNEEIVISNPGTSLTITNYNGGEVFLTGGMVIGTDDGDGDGTQFTLKNIHFQAKGIALNTLRSVTISNCTFTSIEGDAIIIRGDLCTSNINITGCTMNGVTGNGIKLRDPDELSITKNTIRNIGGNAICTELRRGEAEGTMLIQENLLENWGNNGYALLAALTNNGLNNLNFTKNIMIKANSTQSFVKVTGKVTESTCKLHLNYWNGQHPVAAGCVDAEGAAMKNYYQSYDPDTLNLYDSALTAVVAQIGDQVYYSIPKALEAVRDGETLEILLGEDFDGVEDTIVIDKNITLLFGTKGTIKSHKNLSNKPMFRILADVTMTGNGKLWSHIDSKSIVAVIGDENTPGKLTVTGNLDFEAYKTVFYVEQGELNVNIDDGDLKVFEGATAVSSEYLLDCNDENYQNGTAKISVTGGDYYGFNPADNTAEGEGTNFLASGCSTGYYSSSLSYLCYWYISRTVNVINSSQWDTVYAFASGLISNNKNWPGAAMTKTGEQHNGYDIYSIALKSMYSTVVFNNGSKDNQSPKETVHPGGYYDLQTSTWYNSLKDIPAVIPDLPTATVTKAANDDLTFAASFSADPATDAQLEYYQNWNADVELTINKNITLNAGGGADGYLSGYYEAWNNGAWVNAPLENIILQAGQPLKVMVCADEAMDAAGTKRTYGEIYRTFGDFDCGIYLTPEFLVANPDLEVTLALKIYNPADESESHVISEACLFTMEDVVLDVVAQNVNTGKLYKTVAEAVLAARAGETTKLLHNADGERVITVLDSVTLDLNGYELETEYLFCTGDVVDNSEANTGLLKVLNIMLREDNAQLPVNTEAGYKFYDVKGFAIQKMPVNANTDTQEVIFLPYFEAAAHDALLKGKDVTGVSVVLRVSWMNGDDRRSQDFIYGDTMTKKVVESWREVNGKIYYNSNYKLVLNDVSKFLDKGLTYQPYVISNTGVAFSGDESN